MAKIIEGFDKTKGWWFTGNGSFISNGYVIYTNGLDGEKPNPIAVGQGNKFTTSLLNRIDISQKSAFGQFINTLKGIADVSAAAEERYLQLKIQQLRASNNVIETTYFDKIEQAIKMKNYGAAYTLLLKRQKDLKKFQSEISKASHRSFAKTREFFDSQFSKFLVPKFEAQLANQRGLDREIVLDTDFGELIDEFFTDFLKVDLEDNESIELLRQSFINDLKSIEDANGGEIRLSTYLNKENGKVTGARLNRDSAWVVNSKTRKKRQIMPKNLSKSGKPVTTKQGKYRSPRQIAEAWAASLAQYVGRGLGQEAYQIGAFQDIGTHAFSTGKIRQIKYDYFDKQIGNSPLQQKEDILAVEVFRGEIDLDNVIEGVRQSVGNEYSVEWYEELNRRLKNIALSDDVAEIFEIAVNVKGYISNYDLQIEGEGSFTNRLGTLKAANVNGIGEQLVFMLNNTAKGALMSGQKDALQDYIAAACVAWMWDRPEDLFNLNLGAPPNFHKIRLFNSGGAYFTASQIIYQTIAKLQGHIDEQFVQVGITPPPEYSGYTNLLNNPSNNGVTSWNEWQANLKTRWDAVQHDTMEHGALSIKFNQAALNDLLSDLTTILQSK